MNRTAENAPFSQRQLRVGELIKQSLGQIFLRNEAKVPSLETQNITVTEVRMSPDLKNAFKRARRCHKQASGEQANFGGEQGL